MDNNNYGQQRTMVQGNWTCSQCGKEITELPFAPDGERPLYCRDCHKARQGNRPRRRFS